MKKKASTKSKLTVIILVIAFIFTAALSGCSFSSRVSGIEFNVQKLEFIVGEEREITGSVVNVLPTYAEDKTFSLSSSDENIISIVDGTKVYAKGKGEAVLTATSNSGEFKADCPVFVNYSSIRTMELMTEGSLIQHTGSVEKIVFGIKCNGVPDPSTSVYWSVNGAEVKTLSLEEKFTYTPKNESGEVVITAEVESFNGAKLEDSETVKVYSEVVEPKVTFDSTLLTQDLVGFMPVDFKVEFNENPSDPAPTIVWYVNDSICGSEKTFIYKATKAGAFRISCYVNGYKADFNGNEFVNVTAKGVLVPTNLSLNYDNCYPKMIVSWSGMPDGMDYTVNIVNKATGVNVSPNLNTKNASTASLFSENSVDVSSFINTSTVNIFNTAFAISVRADGDESGVFGESDFSEPLITKKINQTAKNYLAKSYYDGNENHYMSSEEDFLDFFSYMVLWRIEKATVYLDYTTNLTGNEIFERALQNRPYTGSYSYLCNYSKTTKILTIDVSYEMDLLPTKQTSAASANSLDSLIPHINLDKATSIGANYNFPINSKLGVTVSNTEQLYHVAERGYRPVPKSGSAAETYYNYAKNVLSYIISPSMTEADIAHAIYDWIMWRVNYDYTVVETVSSTAESVKYKSYYIEGVLTDKNYNAVCDGMSKAFTLMANIMGIPSLRVVGMAGADASSRGGHAWNKALVDGKWYIFDCTWGDSQINVDGKVTESASHDYMFLTDAQVADTHIEDGSEFMPRTTTEKYNWFDRDFEFAYNNKTVALDFHLSSLGTSLSQECANIADYLFYSIPELNADNNLEYYANFNYNVNDNRSVSQYYAIEIQIHPNLRNLFLSNKNQVLSQNPISNAFKAKGYLYGYDYTYSVIYGIDNSLIMFIYAML